MAPEDRRAELRRGARQFLEVIDRDEAEARFRAHLSLSPLGAETVPLARALGRVLACNVLAGVDVPGFERASVDGFAVRAADTVGASGSAPRALRLNGEVLTPGSSLAGRSPRARRPSSPPAGCCRGAPTRS